MARPLRLHVPGMVYHVMSRGNAKQTIFLDDDDYTRYLQLLDRTSRRFRVRCLGYCLLDNHLHLLLQPNEMPISRMLQQLNSAYCQSFNRRHQRVGHVLQGRYKAVLVESPDSVLRVLRYVMMNPVKAGLVPVPSAWKWSSYRATAGLEACPRFLNVEEIWGIFNAPDERSAHQCFTEFVEGSGDISLPERVLLMGSDAFARAFKPLLARHRSVVDYVRRERFADRPPLPDVIRDVSDRTSLLDCVRCAFQEHAYTLREIGLRVGRAPATVWSWINRGSRKLAGSGNAFTEAALSPNPA